MQPMFVGIGLVSAPVDQRTLVGLALAGVPALDKFGECRHVGEGFMPFDACVGCRLSELQPRL
jgi:hypothetical protein